MPYVYLIENQNNGKKYIGITKSSIEERFLQHKAQSKSNTSKRLYQAMNKHGHDAFSCTLIEECANETVFAREIYWIAHYRSNDYKFGYNMTAGGEGCVDRECSSETIEKLRTSVTNHRASLSLEERKQLTKKANNVKLGSTESEHSRALKKEAQKARFASMSEEQRKEHGVKSRNGISEDGKKRQIVGMIHAFSPVREKGFKQQLTTCPHCGKNGGAFAMKRYHFDRCSVRSDED